jgi:hypothetical protein
MLDRHARAAILHEDPHLCALVPHLRGDADRHRPRRGDLQGVAQEIDDGQREAVPMPGHRRQRLDGLERDVASELTRRRGDRIVDGRGDAERVGRLRASFGDLHHVLDEAEYALDAEINRLAMPPTEALSAALGVPVEGVEGPLHRHERVADLVRHHPGMAGRGSRGALRCLPRRGRERWGQGGARLVAQEGGDEDGEGGVLLGSDLVEQRERGRSDVVASAFVSPLLNGQQIHGRQSPHRRPRRWKLSSVVGVIRNEVALPLPQLCRPRP